MTTILTIAALWLGAANVYCPTLWTAEITCTVKYMPLTNHELVVDQYTLDGIYFHEPRWSWDW